MRVSTPITPAIIDAIRTRVDAGEAFSRIAASLHIHYSRMMKALRAEDSAWVAERCAASQYANGQQVGQASSQARPRRKTKPGFRQPGFRFFNQNHATRLALDLDEQDHKARMAKRVRGKEQFSVKELAEIQAKLELWVATHAGRGDLLPW